ncbi:death domain-containing protein CRADD-like [Ptychodera flava]|uniref:death domain-containing protein CRADD-like n=1 Tax=Ptychodera flava TaxID=63121 RepID=UPI003969C51D
MEDRDRQTLNSHRVELTDTIEPRYLVPYLQQNDILHQEMAEQILAGRTRYDQARSLIDTLPTRGPNAFSVFLEALGTHYQWLKEKLILASDGETTMPISSTDTGRISQGAESAGSETVPCEGDSMPAKGIQETAQGDSSQPTAVGAEANPLDEQTRRFEDMHLTSNIITEKELLTVAEKMSSEWEDVAIKLGFEKKDIFRFKKENDTVNQQILHMLVKWKRQLGRQATVEKLCHDLENAGVDIAIYDHLITE